MLPIEVERASARCGVFWAAGKASDGYHGVDGSPLEHSFLQFSKLKPQVSVKKKLLHFALWLLVWRDARSHDGTLPRYHVVLLYRRTQAAARGLPKKALRNEAGI